MATKAVKSPTQEKNVADPVSLQISLSQLLNLALSTPEVGTVNLNMLHNFLHALLNLISLDSAKVEYRGENAIRIKSMLAASGKEPTLELDKNLAVEHTVSTDVGEFAERIKDVEDAVKHMGQIISDLQAAVSQTPEVKVQSNAVTKKQGAPENIEKGHVAATKDEFTRNENPADKSGNPENHVPEEHPVDKDVPAGNEQSVTDKESVPKSITAGKNSTVADKGTRAKEKPAGKPTTDKNPAGKTEVAKPTATKPGNHQNLTAEGVDVVSMHKDIAALKTEMTHLRTDVQNLNVKLEELPTGKRGKEHREMGEESAQLSDTKEATESTVNGRNDTTLEKFWEMVQSMEKTHTELLNELNDRVSELEKEISMSMTKTDIAPTAGITEDSNLNELVGKIEAIQADVEKFNKIAGRLIDDEENRETNMNALIEQIELLKNVKADKEDLEDALADKADAQIVNRKVSHDQFDAAYDDLARGLEDAIAKLAKQEFIWQQALDEVQREIESKVDKIEMTPLKDFISDRLKTLQEKLKTVTEMKEEKDAAGTKKILRDVQCISCNKNVVMKMKEVGKYRADPLPCTVSIKPYLTYELDQVRKQQRRLPHSRNISAFEAALREGARKLKAIKTEATVKSPRDLLCSRYCGGSHTITTPQQRIMRMGHFLSQWGPEVVPLTEGVAHSRDAQTYQCGTLSEKADICRPCYEIEENAPTSTARPTTAPPTIPDQRKTQQRKRSSVTSRRRSSRKSSGEPAAKKVPEAPISVVEEAAAETEIIEDVLPIDPTAHDDQIIRGNDEFNEEEIEYEIYNK